MFKRMRWMAVGLAAGLVMGGVAYAVVVNPPGDGDRYYACVSPSGSVRAGTIRRNSPPTKCPISTDQVQSWNAQGTTGPTGPPGPSSWFAAEPYPLPPATVTPTDAPGAHRCTRELKVSAT